MPASEQSSVASWLPFAQLNLARNPFGELTREDRVAAALVDVERWAKWLAPGGRRALQVIGDSGRGKTTHLLSLAARLPGAHYVHWRPRESWPHLPDSPVLLIDEAQRLPWNVRRRLFSRGKPLVLGTHRDLARPLKRRGYEVATCRPGNQANGEHIRAVMNRRIELARLAAGPTPRLSQRDADVLAQKFGDNVRAIESFLYEQVQRSAGGVDGKVRFVD